MARLYAGAAHLLMTEHMQSMGGNLQALAPPRSTSIHTLLPYAHGDILPRLPIATSQVTPAYVENFKVVDFDGAR